MQLPKRPPAVRYSLCRRGLAAAAILVLGACSGDGEGLDENGQPLPSGGAGGNVGNPPANPPSNPPAPRPVIITQADDLADNPALVTACGRRPDQVVVINDFGYTPLNLQVSRGQTVAWVNLETCGDVPAEAIFPLTGCDNHHQVVTFPMSGTDNISSGPICSPVPGIAAPAGLSLPGFTIDPESCEQERASNVFCHTFTGTGIQHYSCFTNPGHTLLMNGFITVTE